MDIFPHSHSYPVAFGLISSEDLIFSDLNSGVADVLPFSTSSLFCSIDTPRLDTSFVFFFGT